MNEKWFYEWLSEPAEAGDDMEVERRAGIVAVFCAVAAMFDAAEHADDAVRLADMADASEGRSGEAFAKVAVEWANRANVAEARISEEIESAMSLHWNEGIAEVMNDADELATKFAARASDAVADFV